MILLGNIHNYLKSIEMEQKWQQKQMSSQVTALQGLSQTPSTQSKDNVNIQSIINKLNSGKKLNGAEKAYLLKHNPVLYQKAVKIEREREDYSKELKRCKTKKQAQDVYMSKMSSICSDFNKSGGTAAAGDGQMRYMAISEEHKAFISSKEYKRLPLKDENERSVKKAKVRK